MDSNQILSFFRQGLRVTVGATATLIETLQDTEKREISLSEFKTQLSQKAQEWSEKGEITEREARNMIETWLNQRGNQASTESSNINYPNSTSTTTAQEIKELTEEIIALRDELEKVRQSKDGNLQ